MKGFLSVDALKCYSGVSLIGKFLGSTKDCAEKETNCIVSKSIK